MDDVFAALFGGQLWTTQEDIAKFVKSALEAPSPKEMDSFAEQVRAYGGRKRGVVCISCQARLRHREAVDSLAGGARECHGTAEPFVNRRSGYLCVGRSKSVNVEDIGVFSSCSNS